jgi:outer membrane lipoprotein-sorting protein
MMKSAVAASLGLAASVLLPSGSASAAQPESNGPFTDTYSFEVDCGDFLAQVDGTATFQETVFFDSDGDVTRWMQSIRAPRDVWTNTTTEKTIVVRGNFQQTYTPDAETEQVRVAIRGFRYLVNEPGSGVTVQEVGLIVYDDLDETTVLSMAGQHDLADPSTIEPTFCAALR